MLYDAAISDSRDDAAGKPRAWDPTGRDKPGLGPPKFAAMSPAEELETLVGMIDVLKAFGRDPKPIELDVDPSKFAAMSPAGKVETLVGMIDVLKALGHDPKQMLRDTIGGLSPEQKKQLAADPKARAQLRALPNAL